MLELIVLGRVPGTDFQINFTHITSILSLWLAIRLIKIDIQLYHRPDSYKRLGLMRRRRILDYTVQEFCTWLRDTALSIKDMLKALAGSSAFWSMKFLQAAVKTEKRLALGLGKTLRQIRLWHLSLRESQNQSPS